MSIFKRLCCLAACLALVAGLSGSGTAWAAPAQTDEEALKIHKDALKSTRKPWKGLTDEDVRKNREATEEEIRKNREATEKQHEAKQKKQ